MTTYYRIKNTDTNLYLEGYMKEGPIGRFYQDLRAVNSAFAAFSSRGLPGVSLLRYQHYLAKLEIIPVQLVEGTPIYPNTCNAVKKLKFPQPPKYVDLLHYNNEWYEIDGKPYALDPELDKDGNWVYSLHRGHVFQSSHNGTHWMQAAYNPEKDIPEDQLVLGAKLTTIDQVVALGTVEEWQKEGGPWLSSSMTFRPGEPDYNAS